MFKLLRNVKTFSKLKMRKKLLTINWWLTFNIVFKKVLINHERHYGLWKVYGYYADNFETVISYTNKFSKFKCLLQCLFTSSFTEHTKNIQTEQNQNGI